MSSGDAALKLTASLLLLRAADDAIKGLALAENFEPWALCAARDALKDGKKKQVYDERIKTWDKYAGRCVKRLLEILTLAEQAAKLSYPGLSWDEKNNIANHTGQFLAVGSDGGTYVYFSGVQAIAVRMAITGSSLYQGGALQFLRNATHQRPQLVSRRFLENLLKSYRIYSLVSSFVPSYLSTMGIVSKLAHVAFQTWPAFFLPYILGLFSFLGAPYAQEMLTAHGQRGGGQGAQDCFTYLLELFADDDAQPSSIPMMRQDDFRKVLALLENHRSRARPA